MIERPGVAVDDGVDIRRHWRCTDDTDSAEQQLLGAVRAGDSAAYGELYVMHQDAVRRLARQLCRDHDEADDVVADVFCNTLRALGRGGGPHDEARAYLLRSVRHTVAKLRTRKDTGRATPTSPDELDSGVLDDPLAVGGPATEAWCSVAPRFRDVLWSVAVDGCDTSDIAASEEIPPPAAASLVHRAKRALRRAYLCGSVNAPVADAECSAIRALFPSFLDGELAGGTVKRVRRHTSECALCETAMSEVGIARSRLAERCWIVLVPSFLRAVAIDGIHGAGAIPVAAPIVASMIGAAGLVLTVPDDASPIDREPIVAEAPPAGGPAGAGLLVAPWAEHDGGASDPDSTVDRVPDVARSHDHVAVADIDGAAPRAGALPPTVADLPDVPVGDVIDVPPIGPTDALPELTEGLADGLGDALVETTDGLDLVVDETLGVVSSVVERVAEASVGDDGLVDSLVGELPAADALTDVTADTLTDVAPTIDQIAGSVDLGVIGGTVDRTISAVLVLPSD